MANLLRVLVVEDNDRQLLAAELQSGGYDLVHECVQSADKMRAALVRGREAVGALMEESREGITLPVKQAAEAARIPA